MCGIVGATTRARNTTPILLEGLQRLDIAVTIPPAWPCWCPQARAVPA